MVSAIIRCNYGQSLDRINGFVGAVGLAGAVPGLWAVKGGNRLVSEALIATSKINLVKSHVQSVWRDNSSGLFMLKSMNGSVLGGGYKAVVLAIPLHQNISLTVENVNLDEHRGQYEQIIATFVQGSPRASTWSRHDDDLPDAILSSSSILFYNSMGQLSPVDYQKHQPFPISGPLRVWKIFSGESLTDEQISTLFSQARQVKEVKWLAYPRYSSPPLSRPSFILSPGIYQVNAIEWLASAMEMSAIGARNVANLILNNLSEKEKKREGKDEF